MAFHWAVDPRDLFAERAAQMRLGLPADDVDRVRGAVTEMWSDEPGGWVHEWSLLGGKYAADGRHDLAALAYGYAKFPVLADDAKRTAFQRQVEQYQLAAPGFPVALERRVLDLAWGDSTVPVPVHLLSAPDVRADAPVVLASGGVDTWKIDLHNMFAGLALATGARVLAFDIPGTGETPGPLSRDSVQLVDGLATAARELGNGRVGHLGVSMGGFFSAYSGLTGQVDAAVVLGGPVDRSFADPDRRWRHGMAGIFGHAVGFDHEPTPAELATHTTPLTLRDLLDQDANGPMLVINGADDVHVPRDDTLVFEGRRATEVELIPDTGHCAVTRFDVVVPRLIDWLNQQLGN